MTPAKRDFEQFVTWIHRPGTLASTDVRRLANLVMTDFDGLVETSRQHSRRSTYLVDMVRRSLVSTPDDPPDIRAVLLDGAWPWHRLRSMTIGPFRGFRFAESFDLHKRVILFYGPNGSGKTSFCEGLEYSLLGSVVEAEINRIASSTYLTNHHEQRFDPPILLAADYQNREVVVASNLDTFRFCFIEKNRIDAFSRIAARPPAQRTELIATLFGMDKFNEFVGQFNESIDQQLVLTAPKKLELANKRAPLVIDQATVNGEAKSLLDLVDEETTLALAYSADMTYAGLKTLIDDAEPPSRLQQLEEILNALPPAVLGLSRQSLLNAFEAPHSCHQEVTRIAAELKARSNQVSFKDLYTALLALRAIERDHCPACGTPLAHVMSNPFDRATAGLAQLKELGDLQESAKTAQGNVANASRELRRQLTVLATFVALQEEHETPVGRYLSGLAVDPVGDWWTAVYPTKPAHEGAVANILTLEQILKVADRVAAQDAAAETARQERQRHIAERESLNAYQLKIQAQDLKRQQFVTVVAAAKSRIAAFDKDNAQLIREVSKETLDNVRDAPIKAAYDQFLILLRSYRNQLPGTLMAGLNDAAMRLYNEFNHNDLEADKLAALHLPLTGEQKIEISFRGNPQVRVDALRILSEGHIRCLGLAILLAKSQSIQSPLIVFDDVINAIDHDHRRGIRETIFESDHFTQVQLIVTCHSDEFIKDIQQQLPAADCQVYLFRHHLGNYQPRVTGNVASKNYLVRARASKDALENREALALCRRCLEMLSESVWEWLVSHELGVLNLKLTGAGKEPELRNLCEVLRKRLVDATTFDHANRPLLVNAYGRILGIPEANLFWTYLNKGTHEKVNRDDFDAEVVEAVITALEEIDALDLRRRK
jgi:recombinational DNA repair ATPase RecF